MTAFFRSLANILRADVRYLRSWTLVWIGLFVLAGELIIPALTIWTPLPAPFFKMATEQTFQSLGGMLRYISYTALIAALILAHPGAGPRMGWVTTPLPRGALAAAKLSFVVLFLLLPHALVRVLSGFFVFREDPVLVLTMVAGETLLLFLWTGIAAWISVQAAGFPGVLWRMLLAVVVFYMALMLSMAMASISGSDGSTIPTVPQMNWVVSLLLVLAMILGSWGLVFLHYARRRKGLTLGLGLGLIFVVFLTSSSLDLNIPSVQSRGVPQIKQDQPVRETDALTARWDLDTRESRISVAGVDTVYLEFTLDPSLLDVGEYPGSVSRFPGGSAGTHVNHGYFYGSVESVYGDLQRRRWLRQSFPGAEEQGTRDLPPGVTSVPEWEAKMATQFDLRINHLYTILTTPQESSWLQVSICRLDEVQRVRLGQVARWSEDGAPMASWHAMQLMGSRNSFHITERRYRFAWGAASWWQTGEPPGELLLLDLSTKRLWTPQARSWLGYRGPQEVEANYMFLTLDPPAPGKMEVVIYRAEVVRHLKVNFKLETTPRGS